LGTFASETDALAWLSTVEADIHRGQWVDPGPSPNGVAR
jgi:hypothetical protein